VSLLIYVHGTNGSGKSTLARALLAEAGGATGVNYLMKKDGFGLTHHKKVTYTHTQAGVIFIGSYGNACGGVDGLSPYHGIFDVVATNASASRKMFAEGLVTPGLETCQRLADMVEKCLFILLDTPDAQAVRNVLTRRARKGTDKPYDPANLHKKTRSAVSWANRLEDAGLNVARLSWDGAYTASAKLLGLQNERISHLL
jgi:ABC-type oligopeptide transport system ATPase subunit